jgi:hypothetical protein
MAATQQQQNTKAPPPTARLTITHLSCRLAFPVPTSPHPLTADALLVQSQDEVAVKLLLSGRDDGSIAAVADKLLGLWLKDLLPVAETTSMVKVEVDVGPDEEASDSCSGELLGSRDVAAAAVGDSETDAGGLLAWLPLPLALRVTERLGVSNCDTDALALWDAESDWLAVIDNVGVSDADVACVGVADVDWLNVGGAVPVDVRLRVESCVALEVEVEEIVWLKVPLCVRVHVGVHACVEDRELLCEGVGAWLTDAVTAHASFAASTAMPP